MLFGQGIVKNKRYRFFTTFQRKKFRSKSTGFLHSYRDFQNLNWEQFLIPKPEFHLPNRLHIPLSEKHFQTTDFLVVHINFWAIPSPMLNP